MVTPLPSLNGVRLHANPLCVKHEVTWGVEKHPTAKRRRNWRVVQRVRAVPCAYLLADGSLHVHPDLYMKVKLEALKQAAFV